MPSSDQWRWQKHRFIACAFAFVSGYVDIFSVSRWRVFVTMMSGNAIFMGRVLFGNEPSHGEPHKLSYYFVVIASFLLGSISFLCAERKFPNRGASIVALPFTSMMLALEVIAISGLIDPLTKTYSVLVLGYTPLFGILSSATLNGRLGTTTTMGTGHLLSLGNMLVKRVLDGPLSASDWRKTCMSSQILLWIIIGATVGAEVQSRIAKDDKAHGALFWVAPIMLLLFFAHDHLSKPRSVVKLLHSRRRKTGDSGDSGDSNLVVGPRPSLVQADVHVVGHEFDDEEDDEERAGAEVGCESSQARSCTHSRSAHLISRLFSQKQELKQQGREREDSISEADGDSSDDCSADGGADSERPDVHRQACD